MYSIVDVETTGGSSSQSAITEIAICLHDGNKRLRVFHSLVNPGHPIPPFITRITGIDDAMVMNAPYFEEIAAEVFSLLKDNIFVAHNVSFDYSFLKQSLKDSGFLLQVPKLCTVRLGRKIFPGLSSYSLGNFCESMGIEINNRHRAMGDALATSVLFEKMLREKGPAFIHTMLK